MAVDSPVMHCHDTVLLFSQSTIMTYNNTKHITIKPFQALTGDELYHILQLRSHVFVIEQQCLYQDMDDLDLASMHAWIQHQEQIQTYLRIIPPSDCQPAVTLSRVVTHPDHRGQGHASTLLSHCIQNITDQGHQSIVLSAQSYLTHYYERFGFIITSQSYLEDGIPHTDMLRTHKKP